MGTPRDGLGRNSICITVLVDYYSNTLRAHSLFVKRFFVCAGRAGLLPLIAVLPLDCARGPGGGSRDLRLLQRLQRQREIVERLRVARRQPGGDAQGVGGGPRLAPDQIDCATTIPAFRAARG